MLFKKIIIGQLLLTKYVIINHDKINFSNKNSTTTYNNNDTANVLNHCSDNF